MIEEIGEPIDVSAVFAGGLKPRAFRWRGRRYDVSEITGRHVAHQGGYRRYSFAVLAGAEEIYEITLDSRAMTWTLQRVHSGG